VTSALRCMPSSWSYGTSAEPVSRIQVYQTGRFHAGQAGFTQQSPVLMYQFLSGISVSGNMKKPLYRYLTSHDAPGPGTMCCSGSLSPQGNPRHWKYYWRVFSAQFPWEDEEFFRHAPVLCNADFIRELECVHALGEWFTVFAVRARIRSTPGT
jgi:hypothetical protein